MSRPTTEPGDWYAEETCRVEERKAETCALLGVDTYEEAMTLLQQRVDDGWWS